MKKKNIFKKIFFSGFFIPLVIILLAILGNALFKKYNENQAINSDLERLKNEIESLEKNNQDLDHLLEYFSSNFFMEKEAREKLGLKKEGEKVVIVDTGRNYPGEEVGLREVKKSSANPKAEEFLPKKWWDYFFVEEKK